MRFFESLAFLLVGMLLGAFLHHYYFVAGKKKDPMPEAQQEVLLKRIEKVAKLITVEGDYENTFQYGDYDYKPLRFTSKSAVVKGKAKVSVGYDLKKAKFEVDSMNRIIRVKNLPQPEILSIDQELTYEDVQEGMLKGGVLSPDDWRAITRTARQILEKNVKEGPLMQKAKEEGLESLEIIKLLVEQAGWTFEVQGNPLPKRDSVKIEMAEDSQSLKN
jgi:hypothetical protein